MPRAARRKVRLLAIRFTDDDLAIIDRAASQRGRSRTDFVREAAVRAAEEVLVGNLMIRMSSVGSEPLSAIDARQLQSPNSSNSSSSPHPGKWKAAVAELGWHYPFRDRSVIAATCRSPQKGELNL